MDCGDNNVVTGENNTGPPHGEQLCNQVESQVTVAYSNDQEVPPPIVSQTQDSHNCEGSGTARKMKRKNSAPKKFLKKQKI
jgi:hypothetical protein